MTTATRFDPTTLEADAATNGHQPPAIYHSDEEIARLVSRMRFLMPGASTAPDVVIWRAAQLCALHDLDPFGSGDIYLYSPYGENAASPKDWIIHIGIAAWRRKSTGQAKYNLTPRAMTPEETQQHRGELYHANDRGCEMTLYRLDVARECKELGIPYTPVIALGFWREKAFYNKSKKLWFADSLGNTETTEQKAAKRAEAKCLKVAFSLTMPSESDPLSEETTWKIIEDVQTRAASEERIRQPVTRAEPGREPDGDLLWA